jgi:hypothetical protein
MPHLLFGYLDVQEYAGKMKVVKVEHDKNPKLIEKYKASRA